MSVAAASGLERIARAFAKAKAEDRLAVVIYLTVGYPDRASTAALLRAALDGGADVLELGVPFSDPLADGPAIQLASQAALDQGVTLDDVYALAKGVRARHPALPLVAMTYANPVLARGMERFAREAKAAGIDGVIVSDLPPEERPDVWGALSSAGLDTIPLVAPTTSEARLPLVVGRASGFVYCLSRTGVTGDDRAFATELGGLVARVRALTDLPVGIGFGVSDAAKARFVAERADLVIVGAAIARRVEEARPGGADAIVSAVGAFARELAAAVAAVEKPA